METTRWEYAHLEALNGGWVTLSFAHPNGQVTWCERPVAIESYHMAFHALLGWLGGVGWEMVGIATDACASHYSAHLKRIVHDERPTDAPSIPDIIWQAVEAGALRQGMLMTKGVAP